nr:hypothetical protein [uncultured Haemophilus sp.]
MGKIEITTGEAFIERTQAFVESFLDENPIFRKLQLNEQQMVILQSELIGPLFYEKYEVTYSAKKQVYEQLKREII